MELKRKKPKANKFPETPLTFFIKLYCKQRGSSDTKFQSKLIEATKSWLSLTEEQKQQVCETYKEKEHRFRLLCFDQLKNAETFMKAKDPPGWINVNSSSISVIQESEADIEDVTVQTETEQASEIVNNEDLCLGCDEEYLTDFRSENDQEQHHETIREIIHSNEETPRTFLIEPLPPTIKTSKDLYYMLNPLSESGNVSWAELSTYEKKQYSRAVTLLKTDYITKYKEYLESLTPKELFDYYNKTLF